MNLHFVLHLPEGERDRLRVNAIWRLRSQTLQILAAPNSTHPAFLHSEPLTDTYNFVVRSIGIDSLQDVAVRIGHRVAEAGLSVQIEVPGGFGAAVINAPIEEGHE